MREPWTRTYTGLLVNPLNPNPDLINIYDIAHSMSQINRFNGHTRTPINLALHSAWVSRLAENRAPLAQKVLAGRQGLFHDGSEYLLGDVTKWLKMSEAMAGYREAEAYVQTLIYSKFDCPADDLDEVRWADMLMVRCEGEYAWGPEWSIQEGYGALTDEERELVKGWEPVDRFESKWMFIRRFLALGGGGLYVQS